MGKHSGQRKALSVSVTIATRQRVTAARPDAQWSADTPALVARQLLDTSAAQHAETPTSLATRHATTGTPRLVMDAVRTVLLSPAGGALIRLVLGQCAQSDAETARVSGMKRALRISVTTATWLRATAAQLRAELSADTPALVARQLQDTSAAQHAETPSSLATRHATTGTPRLEMDAVGPANRSSDGLAQLSRVVGLIARKCVETVSRPLQKDAMTATRQRATAAAQGAQSSADTIAMDSRLCVPLRHAVTENVQALNHATMEPP